jgi:serine/threonine protein kinase
MEWMPNGSLENLLEKEAQWKMVDATNKLKIVVGVCFAMRYIHAAGVIHRDLKPSNILLDEEFRPHISNFGSSTFTWREATVAAGVGTTVYKAPEADTPTHTTKMDVFSFGMVLWEILTGRPVCQVFQPEVHGKEPMGWQRQIAEGKRPPLIGICPPASHILDSCWKDNPAERCDFGWIIDALQRAETRYELLQNVDTVVIEEYINGIVSSEEENPAPLLMPS